MVHIVHIFQHCKKFPYSCATDGGNDIGTYKMNQVSIYIYGANTSKFVTNHYCNTCLM